MPRQPAPDLEPNNPPCSVCYQDTEFDGDCFVCYTCDAYWDSSYDFAGWNLGGDDEGAEEQCAYTRRTTRGLGQPGHIQWRCLLKLGHDGWHQTGMPEFVE